MKTILLLLASIAAYSQTTQPTPLFVYYKAGVSTDTVIDNRSSVNRQITYVSAACTGTGTWSAGLLYSSDNVTFTSYGATAVIDQSTTLPIAWGYTFALDSALDMAQVSQRHRLCSHPGWLLRILELSQRIA